MRAASWPILLGLAHGLADGTAGYLLGGLGGSAPAAQVVRLVLIYNVLAFALQPMVGLLVDRTRAARPSAAVGLLTIALAAAIGGRWPAAAVAMAGLGSALFHVSGGALALAASGGRAGGPGLFAAPGVVGLAAGAILAAAHAPAALPAAIALAVLAAVVIAMPGPVAPATIVACQGREPTFERHDLAMIAILAAIALRSLAWTAIDYLNAGRLLDLAALAAAAAVGKAAGGFLADRIGWRRWTLGAMLVAAPLLALGPDRPIAALVGAALLQSTTPALLAMLVGRLPSRPATATGLALGLAVAIGGLPFAIGLGPWLAGPVAALAVPLFAALLVAWALRRRTARPPLALLPIVPMTRRSP